MPGVLEKGLLRMGGIGVWCLEKNITEIQEIMERIRIQEIYEDEDIKAIKDKAIEVSKKYKESPPTSSPIPLECRAFHEAGHLIAAWFIGFEIKEISVEPYNSHVLFKLVQEPRSTEEVLKFICLYIAGYLSEVIFYKKDKLPGGAYFDMHFVLRYSLIPARISAFSLVTEAHDQKLLLKLACRRTADLLLRHREDIYKIYDAVMEKAVLNEREVAEILGEQTCIETLVEDALFTSLNRSTWKLRNFFRQYRRTFQRNTKKTEVFQNTDLPMKRPTSPENQVTGVSPETVDEIVRYIFKLYRGFYRKM